MASQPKQKRVCIIGAGVSGLVALKECLHEGFQATCYELDSELGGIWHKKEDGKTSNTPMVWEALYTNTSKYLTCYSDFPPAPEDAIYMTHRALQNYYKRYAAHFNLLPSIKFNTRVAKVCKTPDHSRTGKWEIFTCPTADFRKGDMSPGLTTTPEDLAKCRKEIFDFVVVCSGFFKTPKYPQVQGLDSFQGTVQHSFSYSTGKQYEGKTVLVVGNSFSAGDISNDVSHRARKVYLSVGGGTWIWPRIMSGGRCLDTCFPRSLVYSSEIQINNFIIKEAQNRMDHSSICPVLPPSKSSYMIGDDIYLQIMSNRIQVYGRLKSLDGYEATFEDGSKVTELDSVIVCTGYAADLSFLDVNVIQENGKMDLFDMMFPCTDGPDTLAFVGLFGGDSNIAKVSELQSRYVAKVFAGKLQLPPKKMMRQNADFWSEYSVQRKGNYSYFLPCFVLADSIAQLLGVYPSFWRLLFFDPVLAFRAWWGPQFTAMFRLLGPDSDWKTARQVCYEAYATGNQPLLHKPLRVVKREDIAAHRRKQRTMLAFAVPAITIVAYFACTTSIASRIKEFAL